MISFSSTVDFDDDLFSKLASEYDAGNFTGAVRTAILYLTECIRDRTDLDLDGDKLVSKAFSPKDPIIRLNGLNTESEINEQTGHMQIMQGLYKAIRNPRNHNLKSDDRYTCDSLLILVNFYVRMVKQARTHFDFDELMEAIRDPHFDQSREYCDELVATIPETKRYETGVKIVNQITTGNCSNVGLVIRSLIDTLSDEQTEAFFEHSSEVLHSTKDLSIIRGLIIGTAIQWHSLSKRSRIRIEGLLVKALERADFDSVPVFDKDADFSVDCAPNDWAELAKRLPEIPIPYAKQIPLLTIRQNLRALLMKADWGVDYVFQHFQTFLFDNDYCFHPQFNDVITRLLDAGHETLYRWLTEWGVADDENEPSVMYDEPIRQAIKSYEERKSKGSDDFEDDVPF